jgi:trans-AT polyketide synthase/acyltransferase/oxidoreductase domain-containing protein
MMMVYMFPGQGSQYKGMGKDLFDSFPEEVAIADAILGYSIQTLCVDDPDRLLSKTQFTQPALYVVNALTYLDKLRNTGVVPDYVLGHSLGEYNALYAAGVVDFSTGLRMVKQRGELMGQASGGAMAAVLNCEHATIASILRDHQFDTIDIANFNGPHQTVLSGPTEDIQAAQSYFEKAGAIYIMLNVSAAFHSRYMQPASEQFGHRLKTINFAPPQIPIISNLTGREYQFDDIQKNLQKQITHSVQWVTSIRYLIELGVQKFEEIGPGHVLTKLVKSIVATPFPKAPQGIAHQAKQDSAALLSAEHLGSSEFKKAYNLRYAYVAGAMAKGIASKELVVRMGKAGLMGYYGTGGQKPAVVEEDIRYIQANLTQKESYGINLLCNVVNPAAEMEMVDLFLRYGICHIEAAAFIQMTQALVKYRVKGLMLDNQGELVIKHKVLAKISRPEVAAVFLMPPPLRVVEQLLKNGQITQEEAELSQRVAMADDICVEADSGGHTDMGIVGVLLPTIIRQRDAAYLESPLSHHIRVGTAGGIGTPETALAAFMMGADFVLTGSINQCTVEAGVSDQVKDMLVQMNVQDTDYAPAGDMFEMGARVQVMRKGVFFPARANKLHELWRNHQSWEDIEEKTRQQIETNYFKRSFLEAYEETKQYYLQHMPQEIHKAENNKKHKMALVFRWYFVYSMRLALRGDKDDRVNYQVHTGPAIGAFNQWVKGSALDNWRNRHVDEIAEKLMQATADLFNQRVGVLLKNGEMK